MICKYCNHDMEYKKWHFHSTLVDTIQCRKHLPVKVYYKPAVSSRLGERWIIFYGDYRLVYSVDHDRTYFQLRHPEEGPSKYYENIKKFDGELSIVPERFPDKIKTLLVFS